MKVFQFITGPGDDDVKWIAAETLQRAEAEAARRGWPARGTEVENSTFATANPKQLRAAGVDVVCK